MNKRNSKLALLSLLAVALAPLRAQAGGAIEYTNTGVPVVWDTSKSINYNIGTGKLGTLNNTKAALIVNNAFQAWHSIPGANLSNFQEGDVLNDQSVNGATVGSFLNMLGSATGPFSNIDNPILIATD